jgi:hypothetical protein
VAACGETRDFLHLLKGNILQMSAIFVHTNPPGEPPVLKEIRKDKHEIEQKRLAALRMQQQAQQTVKRNLNL